MELEPGVEFPDLVVIGIYFLIILSVGLWSSKRTSGQGVSSYFLASRNMHFLPVSIAIFLKVEISHVVMIFFIVIAKVGASLFASNIGSEHFIGLAGSGAASGIAIACFELHAMFTMVVLGWIFVPVYRASGVFTMPEYLRKRYGGQRIRIYISCLALMLYVFVKVSADLYAGSIFMDQAFGFKQWYISVLVLLLIAGIFTIAGGLSAVIWTDSVQALIMTCGDPPSDAMHLFRSAVPGKADIPWTGVVFGLPVSAVWYWCTDQVIVQRVLASRNMTHAKAGCMVSAYLKFLPLFLLVLPGMAARILYPNQVGCADPETCEKFCGNRQGCWNIAYPYLVIKLLPAGLRGVMLAVMMAAIMSSLTSIFNSASTVFTIDIWKRFRKGCSEAEQLFVGKVFVVLLVFLSVVWIPVIINTKGSQLFHYMQSVTSFLAPPICAIYVLAIFVPRGAFTGLMVGLAVGLVRFGLEFAYKAPYCGSGLSDTRPDFVKIFVGKVHFLHFGLGLFLLVATVAVIVSLLTKPVDPACVRNTTLSVLDDVLQVKASETQDDRFGITLQLHRLTFWSRHSPAIRLELDDESAEAKETTESV
ncbi:unnamed protein product, partial [Notodromas monacha]